MYILLERGEEREIERERGEEGEERERGEDRREEDLCVEYFLTPA